MNSLQAGVVQSTPSKVIVIGLNSWHANFVSAKQDFSCQSPLMIKPRGRNILVRHCIYASFASQSRTRDGRISLLILTQATNEILGVQNATMLRLHQQGRKAKGWAGIHRNEHLAQRLGWFN